MCASGWKYGDAQVNGHCKECDGPTVDGVAQEGCDYAPEVCETCGDAPCDSSC